ncbi:hypothetical protein [Mycobacterium paraintracellulare]|uniref:hypothetical protein n=1 Tax=Mycobacterium paraintracellulare TaxID=1138383 RepID=UPI0019163BA8|nr:hypothetical protein [Mycobacterium paraintracellulare]
MTATGPQAMRRKLLRRRGWRAPTGPALIAEGDAMAREIATAFAKGHTPTADELVRLAADVRIRADSLADLMETVALVRRRAEAAHKLPRTDYGDGRWEVEV